MVYRLPMAPEKNTPPNLEISNSNHVFNLLILWVNTLLRLSRVVLVLAGFLCAAALAAGQVDRFAGVGWAFSYLSGFNFYNWASLALAHMVFHPPVGQLGLIPMVESDAKKVHGRGQGSWGPGSEPAQCVKVRHKTQREVKSTLPLDGSCYKAARPRACM